MRASTSNPCDEHGEVVLCEKCKEPGRFRRDIPKRDRPGLVYVMGIDGRPMFPRLAETVEVLCANHLHDMGQQAKFSEHLQPIEQLSFEDLQTRDESPREPVADLLDRL